MSVIQISGKWGNVKKVIGSVVGKVKEAMTLETQL